jgi:uncharacterized membrane protein YvbJ
MATGPTTICSACKAPNEAGSVMCKKCGEIMGKKPVRPGKAGEEFDATTGTLSPTCVIVPIVICILIVLVLFFSFRRTPCDQSRETIAAAIRKYDKANANNKLTSLDYEKLKQSGPSGKPFLKEVLPCPYSSVAQYEYDGTVVTCTKCSKKKH